MSLTEVFALPASEIVVWQEYFNNVPFRDERQDLRMANLMSITANLSGRAKKWIEVDAFLPDYWNEHSLAGKSESEQIRAEKEFTDTLLRSGLGVMEKHET